jgi:hypothetical protein
MTAAGEPIDETGTLIRDGGGFALRRDAGGVWRLDLHRVPVDLIEKRARIIGVRAPDGRIEVDGVQPA